MGDIIEFTTLSTNKRLFYKISNNGMCFDIRTTGVAIIGLARVLHAKCLVTIIIGADSETIIGDNHGKIVQVNIQGIVNGEEYKKFWFMQDAEHVMYGRQGETNPILKLPFNECDLNYVTFYCHNQIEKVYWRIELPPLLKVPDNKPITKGKLRWELKDKQLPEDALIGGHEGEPLYIARALLHRSLVLGKYVPSENIAYFSWGGQILREKKFEVLCGYDCMWVPTQENQIPTLAVEAGYSDSDGEPLYIGRVRHRGHLIPGRLQPSQKACYVLYKFQQITAANYEILTLSQGLQSVNTFLIPSEDKTLAMHNFRDLRCNLWGPLYSNDNEYDIIIGYL
ncbi:uncharacterized protein LOC115446388 isoform X1 [Manduca sexta]|uniref:Farnesoic acid O-methyl transferase domain-containing protein n=2 Tax=Manduca sexta TaxID=7130 RepID=A0A922CQJ9_MANSE|nr:uncharacterized protein LOC115446388 isoform X1 [Manduca sexta]KAG6454626.1 hypothetical protein O3G_MSEX008784 [Manduca sexta]